MYNSPFNNLYTPQASLDNINNNIAELEKLKAKLQQQIAQPTNLTQNFQLAPTNRDIIRYAGSLDEVQRELVSGETPFFSKDMSLVWVKNTKGDIKAYELTEIMPKDEKDMQIEFLQSQIEELRREIKNDANVTNVVTAKDTTNTEWDDETTGATIKEIKPTSIQRVSTSKKR